MNGIHVGLLLVFILLNLLLTIYIWLYRKRTSQSKKLIGITAPEVPRRFLDASFIICIVVLVMSVIFLLIEGVFFFIRE